MSSWQLVFGESGEDLAFKVLYIYKVVERGFLCLQNFYILRRMDSKDSEDPMYCSIFAYIWLILLVNVGKIYIRPMNPMGFI